MVFKTVTTIAALQDIDEAVIYYNNKSIGLGEKFYMQFKDAVRRLEINPRYFSYYKKPFRRILIDNFPYLIIYKIYSNKIVITSVVFGKIDPETIAERIK